MQVSLAVLTLVLFVAIFVTVMLLNAPGPFQRLVSTLNGAEGCVSIITRSQTAQEAAFTPVPLGLARSAQQRTEVLCTVAGSDITFSRSETRMRFIERLTLIQRSLSLMPAPTASDTSSSMTVHGTQMSGSTCFESATSFTVKDWARSRSGDVFLTDPPADRRRLLSSSKTLTVPPGYLRGCW